MYLTFVKGKINEKSKKAVTVLNENGLRHIDSYVSYDPHTKIKHISARIYDVLGNEIKKFKVDLPILVISGKLNKELIALLKKRDVKYVIPKPVNPTRLRKMVYEAFRHHNQ